MEGDLEYFENLFAEECRGRVCGVTKRKIPWWWNDEVGKAVN